MNLKENELEREELTGTEVARKIAKESERGLKKGENGTEQCREVERIQKEMKQYRTML